MADSILIEQAGGVAVLTLNRPDAMNALDAETARGLVDALDRLAMERDLRVLVLSASGPVFSAGGDFNWVLTWPQLTAIERRVGADALMAAIDAVRHFPRPTIARVHGAAVGGGVGVMLACDFVLAASTARFGLTSARNGLLAGIAIPGLIEAVGSRVARQLLMHGGLFDSATALRIGFVDQVVEAEKLDDAVVALAGELKLSAPEVQMLAKQLVSRIETMPDDAEVAELVGIEVANQCVSAEAQEGMSAFLAKRTPRWAL
jgi:methylglutaconyl-CoA hydratase